jgi:voltage-gated potassium channel
MAVRPARQIPDTSPAMSTALPVAPSLRAQLHSAFGDPSSRSYQRVQQVVIGLIFLSVASIILETVHPFHEEWAGVFEVLEWVYLIAFGAEYIANIYVAQNKRAYILSFWGVVDLLAIIPSLAMLVQVSGLQELRVLRVLRVLRTLKLIKLATARAREAGKQARHHRSTLWLDLQIYLIALFTVMMIAATLVYHAEEAGEKTPFTNIPAALWWAMGTVSTHGSPFVTVTVPGRIVAGLTMLAGLALFGILTNVIGRALLTSLFGADPDEAAEDRRRAAAREQRRRQVMAAARTAGATVAQGVERTIQAAGPLPSLAAAAPPAPPELNGDPVAARTADGGSHGRPLSMSDGAFLLRSHVASERTSSTDTSPLLRLARAAFVVHTTRLYQVTSQVIIACIFLSVAAITAESVDWVEVQFAPVLAFVEVLVVAVFSIEYAANIYVAEDRQKYIFSFWGIVDLISILPSYVGLLNVTGLKILRTLRVLRILRILKLSKTAALRAQQSVHAERNTLWLDLQIYLIALFTAMILSATVMWYAEKDAGSGFISIPEGLWFAIVTLTTTGSGAPVPVTIFGRLAAAATMITGIALFGVLTSVIGRTMLSSLFGVREEDDDASDTPPAASAGTHAKVGVTT